MLGLVLSLAAILPRSLGGWVALRRRDEIHLIMGFAAGALIGVALLETLPEATDLLREHGTPAGVGVALAGAGAALLALIERPAFGRIHHGDPACGSAAGHVGAGGITLHAFVDGLAVGAAFRAGTGLGLIVAGAVLLHAFSDGLNTVTTVIRHGHGRRTALRWLAADAGAPVAGAALALFLAVPGAVLGMALSLFAGMFLWLGAGSLLPAAHSSRRDTGLVVAATAAGLLLALVLSRLAGE